MVSLFDASKKVNVKGPEGKAARAKIEGAMDWDRVAKDCLGPAEWKKASEGNRKSYRDLLKEVIVKTAFTRLDTFWEGATYTFTKIDPNSEPQISAKYSVKGEELTLDYYISKKGSSYSIYDIAFEDIRYSENIREQITAFLKEKGFSNLIAKLKKRRDELDEAEAAKKK
jgi:ABC-type transporter MlaC component